MKLDNHKVDLWNFSQLSWFILGHKSVVRLTKHFLSLVIF